MARFSDQDPAAGPIALLRAKVREISRLQYCSRSFRRAGAVQLFELEAGHVYALGSIL